MLQKQKKCIDKWKSMDIIEGENRSFHLQTKYKMNINQLLTKENEKNG